MALKTALGVAVGASAMLVAEGHAARTVARFGRALRGRPDLTETLAVRVREKLERLTPHTRAVSFTVEHGCVVLTGDVLTQERALVVREVASVMGVDSVVDLMREHRTPEGVPALVARGPQLATVPRVRSALAKRAPPALRVAAAGVGLALTAAAVKKHDRGGVPLGVLGGVLMAGGVAGAAGAGRVAELMRLRQVVQLDSVVVVRAPAEDAFASFRALENLPRFLRHVRSVERRGARRYTWTLDDADARPLPADVDIVALSFNRRIAWRSAESSRVRIAGDVRFERLAPDTTRVLVRMSYALPFGRDGRAMRAIFGEDPDVQLAEDLQRFAEVVESGAVSSNTPAGL